MSKRPETVSRIIKYSWEEMDRLHRKVALQITAQSYSPDVIIGIMRCGQVPAIHLSYILGVRKVAGILVKTTPSDAPLAKRIDPEVTMQAPDDYLVGKRILLVDAVMESGTTAELCLKALQKYSPTDVRIAMIIDWPTSDYKIASGKRPKIDFWGDRVRLWPDFPW